jgi:hypothetical protein
MKRKKYTSKEVDKKEKSQDVAKARRWKERREEKRCISCRW